YGHVAERRGDEQAGVGLERAEADGDGELVAVAPAGDEVAGGTHGPHHRLGAVRAAKVGVLVAQSCRYQHFQALADELVALPSEQRTRLATDPPDDSVGGDADEGCG